MKQIPLTQGLFALVDDEDFEYLNQFKWHVGGIGNNTYVATQNYKGRRFPSHKKTAWMHRIILGITNPAVYVDHKDGNGLNNQRYNLRIATHGQNKANSIKYKGIKNSKYKGVCINKENNKKKWQANITHNGKKINLGAFYVEEYAAIAYNKSAIELHGEFASINNIDFDKLVKKMETGLTDKHKKAIKLLQEGWKMIRIRTLGSIIRCFLQKMPHESVVIHKDIYDDLVFRGIGNSPHNYINNKKELILTELGKTIDIS